MTRLWLEGVPLRVKLGRNGIPQHFIWQGQSHRIERIWRRWQIDVDWWNDNGRVWRDYLLVTTHDGLLCQIYQEVDGKGWYFVRFYN